MLHCLSCKQQHNELVNDSGFFACKTGGDSNFPGLFVPSSSLYLGGVKGFLQVRCGSVDFSHSPPNKYKFIETNLSVLMGLFWQSFYQKDLLNSSM